MMHALVPVDYDHQYKAYRSITRTPLIPTTNQTVYNMYLISVVMIDSLTKSSIIPDMLTIELPAFPKDGGGGGGKKGNQRDVALGWGGRETKEGKAFS